MNRIDRLLDSALVAVTIGAPFYSLHFLLAAAISAAVATLHVMAWTHEEAGR